MTPFKLLLQLSGLSQREASELLNVSPSNVDKLSRGVRSAQPGIIQEMRDLIEKQEIAASNALDMFDEAGLDSVEIGYPADDYEAQALGWPCVGAWAGMAARVIAGTNATVTLVPRGSTVANAAAVDARDAAAAVRAK